MTQAPIQGEERVGIYRHDGTEAVRALIVDDEDALRGSLARILRQRGIEAETAADGFIALAMLERVPFDVVLVDVQMPGMSGPQFLARAKAAGYSAEILMMTAFADIATTVSAVKAGAHGWLTKPFTSNDAVVMEVLNAAQFRRLREKTDYLQRQLAARPPAGEMVGSSASMREVYRRVDGVASTNSTILVLGESGTGKELVARAIHERSRRASKPMVTLNCAAMPKDLVESELFGHTRGAFTSASAARAGLFEAANGGTLFLDEVGELPAATQVKLLRVLQSGEVKPVGSDTAKTVDVRIVAATNVDLKAAIAAGTFRQDLFYRLNVIAVRLPPLRERGDDLLLLAHHFLQKHALLAGRAASRLSPAAVTLLQRYAWPGNVRELEHAIEHAVVLSQGDEILPRDLPAEVQSPPEAASAATTPALASVSSHPDASPTMVGLVATLGLADLTFPNAKKRVLAEFSDAYVGALVKSTSGNLSEAARRSGLDRSNFRRLLRSRAADAEAASSRSPADVEADAPSSRPPGEEDDA